MKPYGDFRAPNDHSIRRKRPTRACGSAAQPLPRLTIQSEEATCSGRAAASLTLGQARSAGPANGPIVALIDELDGGALLIWVK